MSWQNILKATGVGKDGMSDKAEEVKVNKPTVTYRQTDNLLGTGSIDSSKPLPPKNKNGVNLLYLMTSQLHTDEIKNFMDEWSKTGKIIRGTFDRTIANRQFSRIVNTLKTAVVGKSDDEILHAFSNYAITKEDIPKIKSNLELMEKSIKNSIKPIKEIKQNKVKVILEKLSTKGRNIKLEDMKELDDFLNSPPRETELMEFNAKNNNQARKIIVEATRNLNKNEDEKGNLVDNKDIQYSGIGYDTKGITITNPKGEKIESDFITEAQAEKLAGSKTSSKIKRTKLGRIFDIIEFDDTPVKDDNQGNQTLVPTQSNRVDYLSHIMFKLSGNERFKFLPYMEKGRANDFKGIYYIKDGPTGKLSSTLLHILTHENYDISTLRTPVTKKSVKEFSVFRELSKLDSDKGTKYSSNPDTKKIVDLYRKTVTQKVKPVVYGKNKELTGDKDYVEHRAGLPAFRTAIENDVNNEGLATIWNKMVSESNTKSVISNDLFNILSKYYTDRIDLENNLKTSKKKFRTLVINTADAIQKLTEIKILKVKESDIINILNTYSRLGDVLEKTTLVRNERIIDSNDITFFSVFLSEPIAEVDVIDQFKNHLESIKRSDEGISEGEILSELLNPKMSYQSYGPLPSSGKGIPSSGQSIIADIGSSKHSATFGSILAKVIIIGQAQGNVKLLKDTVQFLDDDVTGDIDDVTLEEIQNILKTEYPKIVNQFILDIDKKMEEVINKPIKLDDKNKDPYTYLVSALQVGGVQNDTI